MRRLFARLSQPVAENRLKSNAFILVLTILIRNLFTPYTTLRGGIIQLFDSRWVSGAIWLLGHSFRALYSHEN